MTTEGPEFFEILQTLKKSNFFGVVPFDLPFNEKNSLKEDLIFARTAQKLTFSLKIEKKCLKVKK